MSNDSSELVEYLSQRFDKVDQRFVEMNDKLSDLQETKADKSDVNNLMNAIDAYAKKADTYFQEMVMLSHKVDRHEK